jgi:phosphatidate phosphatase APP1
MPLIPSREIRVQPYFGFRNAERLVVDVRVLRGGPPEFDLSGGWRTFRTMLRLYNSHEVGGHSVTLEIEAPDGTRHTHEAVSDKEGFCHFEVDLAPAWPLPSQGAWEAITFRWADERGEHGVAGHVLAPGADDAQGVISDIDDTIIETGVTGGVRSVLKNWRRLFATTPDAREPVSGAELFYEALGGGVDEQGDEAGDAMPASRRPFFYVSSSPWNLYPYLVAYMRSRGMPIGPLRLRDWGFDRKTFGKSSHGSHKTDAIHTILSLYPERRFALVGDDSQGDLTAYAKVLDEHPAQISAIFIRKVGEPFSAEEAQAKQAIHAAGVTLYIGRSWDEGRDFLSDSGLGASDDAKTVVDAIEDGAIQEGAIQEGGSE